MDRRKLQQLADLRLKDAEVLLAAGQWDAAYYLLGYCVECAFKACIAQQFLLHTIPEKGLVNSFYTHRLDELLVTSNLKKALTAHTAVDASFKANWDNVKDWNESVRYDIKVKDVDAWALYAAVADLDSGLLSWLQKYW